MRTGPVVVRVRSGIDVLHDSVALLYQLHEVLEPGSFVDFDVSVELPAGPRRWIRPQAVFRFDGRIPFKPLPAPQAFPMLEWGLNWCLSSHLHRYLMIHSAVVARDGGALLLPAPPGSGKSTLCAAMIHSGWRLLSDELTIVEPGSNAITPLVRPVSLKNASIDVIRAFAPDAVLGPLVHDTIKGDVALLRPPEDAVRRSAEAAFARWVVFPKFEKNAAPRLEEMSRAQAAMRLIENSFNYQVHGRRGFETVTELVRHCRCFNLTFGRLEDALPLLDELSRTQAAANPA